MFATTNPLSKFPEQRSKTQQPNLSFMFFKGEGQRMGTGEQREVQSTEDSRMEGGKNNIQRW